MFSTVCYLFSGGKQEFAKGENERDHSDLAHDAGSDFVEKNGTIYHLVAGLGLLHFFIFFSCNTRHRVRVNVAEDLCHKMLVCKFLGKKNIASLMPCVCGPAESLET